MQDQNMSYRNCMIDAIDVVLSWDISEEAFADSVQIQASLIARIDPEDISGYCPH